MAKKQLEKTNQKKHNKGFNKLALIIMFIIILIIIIKIGENVKISKYPDIQIIIDNNNITKELNNAVLLKDDKIYMSFDDIKKVLDETIYQEENTNLIITSSDLKVATLSFDNQETITINGSIQESKNPVINENEKIYINISDLESVYNYRLNYIDTTNIVTIDNLNTKCVKANVKKNVKVKQENKIFSKKIEKILKDEEVIYIDEEKGMAKIRTKNGNIGYINKKILSNITTEREDFDNKTTTINEEPLEYDITKKDITSFKKREEVINLILQEAIKNDKMYIKIKYDGENNFYFDRFKIESTSILKECGITIDI